MSLDALVAVDGIDVSYGKSQALTNVSLEVAAGSVLSVVGSNGAGKSSLARALCGLAIPTAGEIRFDGNSLVGEPPHRIRRLGLAYLPEERGIFPTLSVSENLRMAVRWLPKKAERREALDFAFDLFPALAGRRLQRAGTLSGGEQQMLALVCELATRPRVLIADELSLGLAPLIVDAVFDHLQTAISTGVTIILIEQFIDRALAFADEVLVLRRGEVAWTGDARAITPEDILGRYMGEGSKTKQ